MELQLLVSIAAFVAAMTGTPGPNNMMLTASGANFGFGRTVPHLLGISIGVVSMVLLMSAGLGVVFEQFPIIQTALKWLCSGYLLYLAWHIGTAPPPRRSSGQETETNPGRRPLTWLEATMFQFVNPKAWAAVITAIGSFTLYGEDYWLSALVLAVMFFLVGFPCTACWAGFGMVISKTIQNPGHWRVFNGMMGLATASCLLFIW